MIFFPNSFLHTLKKAQYVKKIVEEVTGTKKINKMVTYKKKPKQK